MAIAISIGLSLIAGITVMYNTQYFWNKEDNPNICAMNNSMNSISNLSSTFSMNIVVIIVIAVFAIAVLMCTMRAGF